MKKLKLHPRIDNMLREIWRHSFYKWGIQQADKYLENIEDYLVKISQGNIKGKSYKVIEDYKLKYTLIQKHYVFYVEETEYVFILAILHSSMDLPNRITELLK